MFRYVSEALYVQICYNLHTFAQWKHKHWIKPRSKFSFHFVDTFEWKVHAEGILDNSFYHYIIPKTVSTDRKKKHFAILFCIR